MTLGNEGQPTAWIKTALLAGMSLLTSCAGTMGPLKPAWQQDSNLYYNGTPARQPQTSKTPHMVARVVYAEPEHLRRLIERQGDVPDAQRGLARMGDGTIELALQDVATGKWIESNLCGGTLFVTGLPNQAYRIILKNKSPLPLELGIGVDGKNLRSGALAARERGGIRIEPRSTLILERMARGPLLFKTVNGDGALYDASAIGRTGLIQIAVFLAADAPSIVPEKLRASQIAPLGFFPIGAPEQYR